MNNSNVTVLEERGGPYVSLIIEIDRYGRFPTAEVTGFSAMEEVFFAEGWRLEREPVPEVETFSDLDSTVDRGWLRRRLRSQRKRTSRVAHA